MIPSTHITFDWGMEAHSIDNGILGEDDTMYSNRTSRFNAQKLDPLIFSRGEEDFSQFARIDSGFLAWDFWLKDREDRKFSVEISAVY